MNNRISIPGHIKQLSASDFQEAVGKKDLSKYDYFIGIDAGVHNGWACYSTFYDTATLSFWQVITRLSELEPKHLIIIENPNLNKPTFQRAGQNFFQMQKIAQNVGSNKRTAQLIIEYCQLHNIDFVEVKPTTAKWDNDTFQRNTGITARTSQHVRDACKLIYEYIKINLSS